MRVRVVGIERQRMAIEAFLFVQPALRAERSAEANQIRRVRFECDRMPILRFGAGVVAELADQAAQVDMRLGIVAAQCQCPFETGDRRAVIALRVVRIARVEVRFRRLRIERQRVLIAGQRFVIAGELAQRRAEVQMRVDQRGIRPPAPADTARSLRRTRLALAARRRSCCARRRNPAATAAPGHSRSSLRRDGRARRPRGRGCSSRRRRCDRV